MPFPLFTRGMILGQGQKSALVNHSSVVAQTEHFQNPLGTVNPPCDLVHCCDLRTTAILVTLTPLSTRGVPLRRKGFS